MTMSLEVDARPARRSAARASSCKLKAQPIRRVSLLVDYSKNRSAAADRKQLSTSLPFGNGSSSSSVMSVASSRRSMSRVELHAALSEVEKLLSLPMMSWTEDTTTTTNAPSSGTPFGEKTNTCLIKDEKDLLQRSRQRHSLLPQTSSSSIPAPTPRASWNLDESLLNKLNDSTCSFNCGDVSSDSDSESDSSDSDSDSDSCDSNSDSDDDSDTSDDESDSVVSELSFAACHSVVSKKPEKAKRSKSLNDSTSNVSFRMKRRVNRENSSTAGSALRLETSLAGILHSDKDLDSSEHKDPLIASMPEINTRRCLTRSKSAIGMEPDLKNKRPIRRAGSLRRSGSMKELFGADSIPAEPSPTQLMQSPRALPVRRNLKGSLRKKSARNLLQQMSSQRMPTLPASNPMDDCSRRIYSTRVSGEVSNSSTLDLEAGESPGVKRMVRTKSALGLGASMARLTRDNSGRNLRAERRANRRRSLQVNKPKSKSSTTLMEDDSIVQPRRRVSSVAKSASSCTLLSSSRSSPSGIDESPGANGNASSKRGELQENLTGKHQTGRKDLAILALSRLRRSVQ